MQDFMIKHEKRLIDFSCMSQTVGARVDYVQGGGGNTSVKLDDQLMAIKASGYKLSDINQDSAYAVLDYAELRKFYNENKPENFPDVEKAGSEAAKAAIQSVEGLAKLRPSVEAGFHSLLQTFVVHSHSVFANLVACVSNSTEIMDAVLNDTSYTWCWVPYTDPGARLTFAIHDELRRVKETTGKEAQIILMQNHGLIVADDDANNCVLIHEEVNKRLAHYFGLDLNAFPTIKVEKVGDDCFKSATPWLNEKLSQYQPDQDFFDSYVLYPDQLVFLDDALQFDGKSPKPNKALLHQNGNITYAMPEANALLIEQTLAAIFFIIFNIQEKGLELTTMGTEELNFIANWESEKYRKKLADNQK